MILYCRRQRRLGRGQPERLGQREQVLQRLPGRAVREPQAHRRPRQPGHLQPLSDRLGGGLLDAVPDVQALLAYPGGTCDPLVISWPKGIKAKGEVRHQYHHSIDIVPTILDVCGLEMPEVVQGRRAVSALRRLDALHLRRRRRARPRRSAQYYAMLGTRGIWEDGWKAVAVHAPADGQRPLRQRRLAALPHRHRPFGVERSWPKRTPRSCRRSSRPGSKRRRRTSCCRSTTARRRNPQRLNGHRRNHRVRATSTTRTRLRSRRASPSTREVARTRSSPMSKSRIQTRRA